MSDLRHQIENLSASEKAELLDAVWESLEADALSLTDAQRAELDHRIQQFGFLGGGETFYLVPQVAHCV